MQEETVEFKMDVSDESRKQEAMKVVWMFSGVTFVDINEKGIIKVRGKFDKIGMGSKLHEIDESVDVINPMGKPEQNRIPGFSTVYNYFTTPKVQNIVLFKFKVLDESMKHDVMEVIWEFSGITSVEVKGVNQLQVKGGEFNKIAMSTKVKGIDENVDVIFNGGPDVQVDVTNIKINNARKVPARVPIRAPTLAPAPALEPAHSRKRALLSPRRIYVPVKTSIWKKCSRSISLQFRRLCR